MGALVPLRGYQSEAVERARGAIREGARSILLCAPTGAGKTLIAAYLIASAVEKGKKSNFVVDRLSLIEQTSQVFDDYGIPHGVVQADHPRSDKDASVQVCSVQTLARREWPASDLDVIDEAHILHEAEKARIKVSGGITLGLTATPFTKGLSNYFQAFVNVATTHGLIEAGFLSPYRIFACAKPDMEGVRVKSSGEWDEKESSSRALEVVGDVVAEYIKHGEDRKFICSGVDTAHVMELKRQFLSAGINVESYTYKDLDEDRVDAVKEFRKLDSQIKGLITVTAASRGFDVPSVSCIIMARPLRKSLAEHIQLFGRGLRVSEGKVNCLVLCHSGNAERFFAKTEAYFECGLDALPKGKESEKKEVAKKEVEPATCPDCGCVHRPRPQCPECGYEYPKKRPVTHTPGTLKELIGGGYIKELNENIWPQVVGYVLERRSGEPAKRQAMAIFRDMTRQWPKKKWESTQPKECSHEVRNKIRSLQIAFANRRASQ